MAEQLSKTARASLRVEGQGAGRFPVAFVFEHRPGQMQTRPFKVFYVKGEAEEFVKQDPERFHVVEWTTVGRPK